MGLRRSQTQAVHSVHLQIDYELYNANYYYCMSLYGG